MVFKIIGAILLIILLVVSSLWFVGALRESFKIQKEVNGQEGFCYFDRGWIQTPFVRVCRTEDSLVFEKREKNERRG